MSIRVQPGGLYEATLEAAPVGLVGVLGFRVIDPSDGSIETPRRTTGIQEAAPGVYWTQELAPITADQYMILWDYSGTTAAEDLIVGTALLPTLGIPVSGYATLEDIRAYAPELATASDTDVTRELRFAERDVDWYAGFAGARNSISGLRFDPVTDLDGPVREALTRAVCAQVQYRFYMGPSFFVDEVQYPEVTGRDGTTRKAQRVGPQARAEFPRSLRKYTGKFA